MKKYTFVLMVFLFCFGFRAEAQLFGKRSIQKVLTKPLEKELPKLVNKKVNADQFQLDKVKLGSRNLKARGRFSLRSKGELVFTEPVLFKGKINKKLKKLSLRNLKVHLPGDNFLFFKRYRRLV